MCDTTRDGRTGTSSLTHALNRCGSRAPRSSDVDQPDRLVKFRFATGLRALVHRCLRRPAAAGHATEWSEPPRALAHPLRALVGPAGSGDSPCPLKHETRGPADSSWRPGRWPPGCPHPWAPAHHAWHCGPTNDCTFVRRNCRMVRRTRARGPESWTPAHPLCAAVGPVGLGDSRIHARRQRFACTYMEALRDRTFKCGRPSAARGRTGRGSRRLRCNRVGVEYASTSSGPRRPRGRPRFRLWATRRGSGSAAAARLRACT